MLRSQLLEKLVTQSHGLAVSDIDRIINVFFTTVSDALESNRRVELRGFGAFSSRSRPARIGRNPKTGEAVAIPEMRSVQFRAGKSLLGRMNAATR